MNTKAILGALSFSIGCLALSGTIQAAPIIYNDASTFMNAVTVPGATVGTDTFDDLNDGQNLGTTSISRNAGAISYTASSSAGPLWTGGTPENGFLTTDQGGSLITASGFSLDVTSFGMNVFGSDFFSLPTEGRNIRILVSDVMNNSFDYLLEATTRDTYFGFIGEYALTSISVSRVTIGDWPSMDNLTLASAGGPSNNIPTPMTLLLMGIGLLGIAVTRRRRI